MAFNRLLQACAVSALLVMPAAPLAQQQTPAAPPVAQAPAQPVLQTPAEDDAGAAEEATEVAQAGEDAEEEQVALSPEEIAQETQRCKAARKRSLKRCLASDLECRRAAMQRHKACLASLQPS